MNHLSTEDFAQITEDWPGFRANYCKLKGISQDDLSYLLKHKLIEADDFQYDFKVMEGKDVKEPHTPEEKKILKHLIDAWSLMLKLDSTHPDHCRDFADGIHKCQDVLIHRVVQRDYPHVYPVRK